MHHPYWFGVTYSFRCPFCCKLTTEREVVNSPSTDMVEVIKLSNYKNLKCLHCKKPLQDGISATVDLKPATLESLRAEGFPVPPD